MLWRKTEKAINQWIKESNSALLVNGARQVGKTYLIRECLKRAECDFLEINLIEQPELVDLLDKARTVEDIVIGLSAVLNHTFIKGETILFIDEVQELKDIVTRIKFWVDEGSFGYIMSGSLLGVELVDLRSAPVGYLNKIKMYPLDFEEFLVASGVNAETIEYLHNCYINREQVSDVVHDKMVQHFKRYLIVGGMPAAVSEYVNTGDISKVSVIQQNIIELYKMDFIKYEKKEKKLMLISIFNQIPAQLLKQNRRFNYSDIKKGLRFEKVESSFLWLISAGVVIPVYNATEPRVSLEQNVKSSLVKMYSFDVGLLTYQLGSAMRMKILTDNGVINMGGVYENAVAQELKAHGFNGYFYNSHKSGELDFLVEKSGNVLPIEVKSGKDYYVHSALSKVLSTEEYGVPEAYIFADCNVEVKEKMVYLPVYMIDFVLDDIELPVLAPI